MWPLFVVATAAFGSAALLCSLFDGSGGIQHRIAHRWGGVLLRITGSPARVIGAENLRKCPVAVYVANHLSYMDTPVVLSRIPFQFRILARAPLFKLPFIGWYLRRSGQISVDATSAYSSLASLNGGVKALRSGMPLVVFPEGSRSPDGRLQSFLSGPAYLAIRARVPVVPMALVGTYELMPMHTYHLQPRPLLLVAGEPISTEGYTVKMADALTARIRQAIESLHAQYSSVLEFAEPTGTSERSS
jgi:1-acyl-sn-glycerol-3-phosphate acyltransferase